MKIAFFLFGLSLTLPMVANAGTPVYPDYQQRAMASCRDNFPVMRYDLLKEEGPVKVLKQRTIHCAPKTGGYVLEIHCDTEAKTCTAPRETREPVTHFEQRFKLKSVPTIRT